MFNLCINEGVRLLGNHESPYISLHLLNQKSASSGIFYYIMVRKIMWHKMIEEQLLDDPGAVILLYKQVPFWFFLLVLNYSNTTFSQELVVFCFHFSKDLRI